MSKKKKKKSTQKLSNRILINIKSNALKSFALFNPEKLFKETNKMEKKKSQAWSERLNEHGYVTTCYRVCNKLYICSELGISALLCDEHWTVSMVMIISACWMEIEREHSVWMTVNFLCWCRRQWYANGLHTSPDGVCLFPASQVRSADGECMCEAAR